MRSGRLLLFCNQTQLDFEPWGGLLLSPGTSFIVSQVTLHAFHLRASWRDQTR